MFNWLRVAPISAGPVVVDVASQKQLRRSARVLLWTLLLGIELFNAIMLALLATSYYTSNTRDSLLWIALLYFLYADGYDFIERNSAVVATAYAVLCSAFTIMISRMLYRSIKHKELRFGKLAPIPPTPIPSENPLQLSTRNTHASLISASFHAIRHRLKKLLFGISIHGPYFELRLVADEVFELASQTIAAYYSSISVSNIYLNQTYGVVIFLNTISALVFHRIFRKSRIRQRIACLVTDLVLDFVWGSLLPVWMYIPILNIYYQAISGAVEDLETSTKFFERVLVLSWPNFFLSVVPFFNSLLNLLEVQSILCKMASPGVASLSRKRRSISLRAQLSDDSLHDIIPVAHKRWVSRVASGAHYVFALYGCAILFVSLSANEVFGGVVRQPKFDCGFRVHPWFSHKEACARRRINCSAVGISGSAADLEQALLYFDEDSLTDLHITDCPNLEIPSILDRFPEFLSLEIADSFVVDWSMSAAMTQHAFPQLRSIKLLGIGTNVTLDGLVSTHISQRIEYIRLADVPQAAQILGMVGLNWHHVKYFDCDRCNLTQVPAVVDEMPRMVTFSLTGNDIVDLDDDFITRWRLNLHGLWVDRNYRLTALSDVIWRQAASLNIFNVQYSNVSSIPAWLPNVAHSQFVLYAFGAPLCDKSLGLLHDASQELLKLVSCVPYEVDA